MEKLTCGNFSGTSSLKSRGTKGSIGHTFMVCIHTENQNQGDFYPFVLLEISVLHEPPLGHLIKKNWLASTYVLNRLF